MEELICKECGKKFEYKNMSSCKAKLREHLKIAHNMELVDYIVKYEYNGIHPICPCGCGNKLSLAGSGDRWKFNTYYADTCYGNLVKQGNEKIAKMHKEQCKHVFDIVKYYEANYDRKTYQEAFDRLKTKTISMMDIAKSYHIDKRTLKKVWLGLNITTPEELTELLEYTKYNLSSINYPTNIVENNGDMLVWMYMLIKSTPGKYNISSLITEYNRKHEGNPCANTSTSILKGLYKLYGDEINIYLAEGYHSSEEYEFYQVLKFYLPNITIKVGKKFILEQGYVFYDFLINDKLLIEYDSDGLYHTSDKAKETDAIKTKFALDNGYFFLRLNKEDIRNINTLTKIKNIVYETNRN